MILKAEIFFSSFQSCVMPELDSPLRVWRHLPFFKSQTRKLPSQLPDTASRPSGVILTAWINHECPSRVWRHWQLSISQTRRVLSQLPDTASRPSGVMLTAETPSECPSRVQRQAGCGLYLGRAPLVFNSIMASVWWSAFFCPASATGPESAKLYACWIQNQGWDAYLTRLCASVLMNCEKALILSNRLDSLMIRLVSSSISSSVHGRTKGIT